MENSDKKWSKSELRLHKDGIAALAAAVVRQWKEDGKPQSDWEGVRPWLAILEDRAYERPD